MQKQQYLLVIGIICAFLGALDAGYLASLALTGNPLTCNFIEGCEVVAMSPYSRILGVPLSLFGFFFYIVGILTFLWALVRPNLFANRLILLVSASGLVASLYFAYLQAFVIRAWCEYCIFSGIMAALVFIVALLYIRLKSVPKEVQPHTET